jgi:hypothetical protein
MAEPEDWWADGDIIRAKGIMDGAPTLAEAINRVREFAADLQKLADGGWELDDVVADDYGLIRKA